MSHHGNNPLDDGGGPDVRAELSAHMRKLLGEFPAGKLNADDSGAIAMAVGVENHRVVIRFPKPVAWVGMTGDEAFELAQSLLRHARNAGVTAPLVITVGG
jgi:hypothetical protein